MSIEAGTRSVVIGLSSRRRVVVASSGCRRVVGLSSHHRVVVASLGCCRVVGLSSHRRVVVASSGCHRIVRLSSCRRIVIGLLHHRIIIRAVVGIYLTSSCSRRCGEVSDEVAGWDISCLPHGYPTRASTVIASSCIVIAVITSSRRRQAGVGIYLTSSCSRWCGEVSDEVAGWDISCAYPMGTLPGPPPPLR
jgi:hypothetical protein